MQAEVLEVLESPDLTIYAVWEPILRTDTERTARRATILLPDSRVKHFWTPSTALGEVFQGPLELQGEPAWDVYLVYPKGVRWQGEAPPEPKVFMHQLGGRLPEDRLLDGARLAEELRVALRSR